MGFRFFLFALGFSVQLLVCSCLVTLYIWWRVGGWLLILRYGGDLRTVANMRPNFFSHISIEQESIMKVFFVSHTLLEQRKVHEGFFFSHTLLNRERFYDGSFRLHTSILMRKVL